MKHNDFAIRMLVSNLREKAMRKSTPAKLAGTMYEAAEVIEQLMPHEPATNRDWLCSLSAVELIDWIKNTAAGMSDAELLKWMEERHE